MCLYIDSKYHSVDKRGGIKRRRATQDILVYKVLKPVADNYGKSPYQEMIWIFGQENKAVMKVYDGCIVEEGLHSCLTRASASEHNPSYDKRVTYPAIIPKGSLLIYGIDDEVVSNRLIVYRDTAQLVKARGAIGPAIARGTIANFSKAK